MLRDRAASRRLLDLAWKAPFVLAATLMVGAGAAQSAGRTGVPPLAAIAALALASAGVVLGVLALWQPRRPHPVVALRSLAHGIRSRLHHVTHRALHRPSSPKDPS